MINIEELKPQIIEALMPLKPDKIILFGSYAYGAPNEDSDIDLYIVTNDDFIPNDFNENFKVKMKYFTALDDFTDKFATDLLIHTKQMHKRFLALNSSFSKKITKGGEILYVQS